MYRCGAKSGGDPYRADLEASKVFQAQRMYSYGQDFFVLILMASLSPIPSLEVIEVQLSQHMI